MESIRKPQDLPSEIPKRVSTPEQERAWSEFKKAADNKFVEVADKIEVREPHGGIDSDIATSEEIVLDFEDGRRAILERVNPEANLPPRQFVQVMDLQIFADNKQIDYNYGNDGIVRKRIIDHARDNEIPMISVNSSPSEMLSAAEETYRIAVEKSENMQLEEEMGVNNQPVGAEELDEITSLLITAQPANLEY